MGAARNSYLAFGMMAITSDAVKAHTDPRALGSRVGYGDPQTHRLRNLTEDYVEFGVILVTEYNVLYPCHENLE